MIDPKDSNFKFDQLVQLFQTINEITGDIQKDICLSLLEDPSNREKLIKQLKQSESEVETEVNKAIGHFLSVMPIATMNKYNLFCKVFGMHSNLTGSNTMHEVLEEVNKRVFDEMEGY
jgi:hypothetical protein